MVRRPPRERKIPGSNPACAGIFSGSSHTSDLKIDSPVATLPGAWRYRVSTGTGRPCVSILWLGEVESLICNFYLSEAASKIACADPSLRYTFYNLLTAPRTVSNTYAQVARAQSCANHVQRIERLSRATCRATCHVVRKDSSAITFDRVEIAFVWALFFWLNH